MKIRICIEKGPKECKPKTKDINSDLTILIFFPNLSTEHELIKKKKKSFKL